MELKKDTSVVNNKDLLELCLDVAKNPDPHFTPDMMSHEENSASLHTVLQYLLYRSDLSYSQRVLLENNVAEILRAMRT